jgi:hypothetical protein
MFLDETTKQKWRDARSAIEALWPSGWQPPG